MTPPPVPPSLAKMPLRYNVWIGLAYLGVVIGLGIIAGGLQGVMCTVLVAMFSFQFWTYACWRGITKAAEEANRVESS